MFYSYQTLLDVAAKMKKSCLTMHVWSSSLKASENDLIITQVATNNSTETCENEILCPDVSQSANYRNQIVKFFAAKKMNLDIEVPLAS